jgi:hypothetical protein
MKHLRLAAGNKKKRAFTQARDEGILNSTEDGKRSALRVPTEVVEKIIG